jgi:hypothetical protein
MSATEPFEETPANLKEEIEEKQINFKTLVKDDKMSTLNPEDTLQSQSNHFTHRKRRSKKRSKNK